MTQTGIPASGMYGPGDYGPDFVTIEDMEDEMYSLPDSGDQADDDFADLNAQIMQRKAIVDCLLDLAHDLDARGLVMKTSDEWQQMWKEAYYIGRWGAPG